MFGDNLKMAIASIRASRLRSFLTLLGVIIGVFSVITTVSFAQGLKNQVINETNKLGTDVLTVRPGQPFKKDQYGIISEINVLSPTVTSSVLSEKDLATIRDTEGVRSAVPLVLVSGVPKHENNKMEQAVIIGTTPALPEMFNQEIEFGSFFREKDGNEKTAVIGALVAEKLFGEIVPIGQTFNLRGNDFFVQGVFERYKTISVSQGIDFNNAIFIPYQAAKDINNGAAQPFEILVRANHVEQIGQLESRLRENLKKNRGGQEDFTILQADDTQAVTGNVIDVVTAMAGGIAIISMLVGGIGIMNVMLVSVSERTREIGIRKAVGATNHQIRQQFILEATVLSIWGALLGVIFSGLFNIFVRITTNLQPVISWWVLLLSIFASVIIGVVFGTAPAIKASLKDPIDALRSGE